MKKSELQKALEIVKPGLASDDFFEQAASFAFINGEVVTFNDSISIRHKVEGLDIEGAVRAELLYQLLAKIKKDDIDVSLEVNKKELRLEAGKIKAGIALEKEVKMPLHEVPEAKKWAKLPDSFSSHLKLAAPTCSADFSENAELTCVQVSPETIEATDRFRIFKAENSEPIDTEPFLLPNTSALQVAQMNPKEVSLTKGWVHFKSQDGKTIISARIVKTETPFPDIDKYIELEGIKAPFPDSMKEVIERVRIFTKKDDPLLEEAVVEIKEGELSINGNSENGWYEEKESIDYEGDEIFFRITPYLLKDLFANTSECMIGKNIAKNVPLIKFENEEHNWEYAIVLRK